MSRIITRLGLASVVVTAAVLAPSSVDAFCGFYVAGSNEKLFNDATQVVLMRDGTRTVLAMQNNYKGPPETFAMVIPVPVVLHEGDVKTLPKDVFDRVDTMGAPRLVEYWEQDPCAPTPDPRMLQMTPSAMPKGAMAGAGRPADLGVTIEAKFVVGEYQIVILSAKDSTGLDTWLRSEKYQIPDGAEPLLRPYVEGGMKFFVAKVDPSKVQFVDGRAALSPIRFHYDSDDFTLPIRLGLANSSGTQDLIVNILAPHQRYEVSNYPNVTIPTNIDVKETVKDHFAAFYASLFDRTTQKNPKAVVTEYAWQATTCDPCPGPTLNPQDFALLGADVISSKTQPTTGGPPGSLPRSDLVLTRLHARYGKDISDDLHFKAAEPIVGGREFVREQGKLEEGARPDRINNFQGRYAIRHPWTGQVSCQEPHRGIWGGPPSGGGKKTIPATNLAFAARNSIELTQVVNRDIPEIDIKAADKSTVSDQPGSDSPSTPRAQPSKAARNGCCQGAPTTSSIFLALAILGMLVIPRGWLRRPMPGRTR